MTDSLFPESNKTNQRVKKKRGPNAQSRSQREASSTVAKESKDEVFEYWRQRHNKRVAIMDPKRDARIGWAIKNYGVKKCKDAIDGCLVSDWHMGKNPNGKKYNDINNIFCDAQHVEMFLDKLEKASGKTARQEWIEEQ